MNEIRIFCFGIALFGCIAGEATAQVAPRVMPTLPGAELTGIMGFDGDDVVLFWRSIADGARHLTTHRVLPTIGAPRAQGKADGMLGYWLSVPRTLRAILHKFVS